MLTPEMVDRSEDMREAYRRGYSACLRDMKDVIEQFIEKEKEDAEVQA